MMSLDQIAEFLARGGVVQRCPTAAVGASAQLTVSAEDRNRVRDHEAARERQYEARAAMRRAVERAMLRGPAAGL